MVIKDANWRPEGWNKIKLDSKNQFDDDYFEAGANAMLEAIQKQFNLTLLSLDYKGNPIVVKDGDRLVIGIKPKSSEMPFFISDFLFNRDHILSCIYIAIPELKGGDFSCHGK